MTSVKIHAALARAGGVDRAPVSRRLVDRAHALVDSGVPRWPRVSHYPRRRGGGASCRPGAAPLHRGIAEQVVLRRLRRGRGIDHAEVDGRRPRRHSIDCRGRASPSPDTRGKRLKVTRADRWHPHDNATPQTSARLPTLPNGSVDPRAARSRQPRARPFPLLLCQSRRDGCRGRDEVRISQERLKDDVG